MSNGNGRRMPKPSGGRHWDQAEDVLDADGRPTCRWCKGVLPKRRPSYCSDACALEWNRRLSWKITREIVMERAKYRCKGCDIDVRMIDPRFCEKQLIYSQRIEARKDARESWRKWNPPVHLDAAGLPFPADAWHRQYIKAIDWCRQNKCLGKHPGQVDHRKPVAAGGDYFDLAGLDLLCCACHVIKSREDMAVIKAYKAAKGA